MNHTTNYNLSQWEASDRIQRTDFNADNQKIDAAIHSVAAAKCEIVTGTYTGDEAPEQNINLGRKPKVVFVSTADCDSNSGGCYTSGCATQEMPAIHNQKSILTITETGFTVYYHRFSPGSYIGTNSLNARYRYIAFF